MKKILLVSVLMGWCVLTKTTVYNRMPETGIWRLLQDGATQQIYRGVPDYKKTVTLNHDYYESTKELLDRAPSGQILSYELSGTVWVSEDQAVYDEEKKLARSGSKQECESATLDDYEFIQ